MAGMPLEADVSSVTDSIKINHFYPNHVLLTDSIINYGKIFLNTPYHYGSPGVASFDCSGFTSHVFRNFGYNLERSSADQAKQFDSIDRTQLKAGDLVFFSGRHKSKHVGHVGIVVSAKENGEFDFIHSAVHKGVTISNSNEDYYTKRFIKASRVVGADQMLAISKFVARSENQSKDAPAFTPVSTPVQTIRKVIPAEYHHVKSGETLSSISKKYGMTVEELKQRNNIKGNKLNPKQRLKIKDEETDMVVEPVQTSANSPVLLAENVGTKHVEASKEEQNAAATQTNASHLVKKGETLFSISKLYNISIDELKNINKILKGKIHPGQQLKINHSVEQPKNEQLAKADEAPKSTTHKVLSGETLYGISKTYNIRVDELKKINNIPDGKIHPGDNLRLNQDNEVKAKNQVAERIDKRPVARVENNEKTITHKIIKGENLGSIARNYNITVDELMRVNNLTDSKIHQGQELKIVRDEESKAQLIAQKADKKQGIKEKNHDNAITHKIKRGENLGSIAKSYNITVDELMSMNNLTDSKIHQGQELKILQDNDIKTKNIIAEKAERKQDVKVKNNDKTITHTIQRGENLSSIAKDFNLTVDELKKMNNLTDNKIHQGQELKIIHENESKSQLVAEKADKKKDARSENKGNSITYKVRKGESLISIAKDNNISVDELKKINNLSDSKIKFGQELKLTQATEEPKHANLKNESEPKSIQHQVKPGESFYTIAKTYKCTVKELEEWNQKSGSKIKIGEKIIVHPRGTI
ncbi:MAG: LysM peptidoglycan-binding domain-containing protein [Bacteroidota bacterium]|nr:LysM peptidoglycan-binding domain-containing protein [Bacteroidota bacterium]